MEIHTFVMQWILEWENLQGLYFYDANGRSPEQQKEKKP